MTSVDPREYREKRPTWRLPQFWPVIAGAVVGGVAFLVAPDAWWLIVSAGAVVIALAYVGRDLSKRRR